MSVSLRYRLTEPREGREGELEGMDRSFDQQNLWKEVFSLQGINLIFSEIIHGVIIYIQTSKFLSCLTDFKLSVNRWFASPPCWWTKQKKICSQSVHKNGSELPEEKNLIVPVHQHGRRDVTPFPSSFKTSLRKRG